MKLGRAARRAFAILPGFWCWLLVLVCTIIFSQALRSPLSAVVLTLVATLPVLELIYIVIGIASIKLMIKTDETEVLKRTPVSFEIMLSNESPLPFPFAEADIVLPDKNALRDDRSRVALSLAPLSVYSVKREVSFPYRGSYRIGVEAVYICDLFRFFRIRLSLFGSNDIFVMPRRMRIDSRSNVAASDADADLTRQAKGNDRYEVSGIRDYRVGDGMKSIHWKLSSKTQDLLVREFVMDADRRAVVLCDTAARYICGGDSPFGEDTNEFVADLCAETALALCLRELRAENSCTLVWADSRAEDGQAMYSMSSPAELDRIWREFATFPLTRGKISELTRMVMELDNANGSTFAVVTGELSSATIEALTALAAMLRENGGKGGLELYLINPSSRISNRSARTDFEETRRSAVDSLRAAQIEVSEVKV